MDHLILAVTVLKRSFESGLHARCDPRVSTPRIR